MSCLASTSAATGLRSVARAAPRRSVATLARRASPHITARLGGGNVLDRPSTDLGKGWRGGDSAGGIDVVTTLPRPDTDGGSGSVDPSKRAPPGGGNYRVLLLDSPKHSERLVVTAITRVVPNADEAHAKNCFHTSRQLGMAIVTSCLKEHAEFYQQQLYQYGCRSSIEPDSVTA